MTRYISTAALWLLCVLMLACGGPVQPLPVTGTIELLDVHVAVRPDGGLDVRETLRVTPVDGRIALSRHISSQTADAISFGEAFVDRGPLSPGTAGFDVSGGGNRPLVLSWRDDGRTEPATIELHYAVTSAVGVRRLRGELAWPVLDGSAPAIGEVIARLDVPGGSPVYPGTGMAEAGWAVDVDGERVTSRRERVEAGATATLLAVFDVDRARVQQGQWEWDIDRREQYGLSLVAGGLFILTIGVGVLALLRVQYPPVSRAATDDTRRAARATRRMLSRGLLLSGVVTLIFAGAFTFVAWRWLSGLGLAIHSLSAASGAVALMFLVAGWWYGRGQGKGRG